LVVSLRLKSREVMAWAPPPVGRPIFLQGGAVADRTKNKRNADRHATQERIHRLLTKIENRFESESGKASAADYIRLLQLERQLEEDEGPQKISVTWGSSWAGKKSGPLS